MTTLIDLLNAARFLHEFQAHARDSECLRCGRERAVPWHCRQLPLGLR